MALATYSDLLSELQDWFFGRNDIAAKLPTFLRLFEADANGNLFCRQMENFVTTTIDTTQTNCELVSLPVDYQTMRRIRIVNSNNPGQKATLKYATPGQIDDWRDENDDPCQPVFYTIWGGTCELYPTPDQDYPVNMIYRANLPPLDPITNTTNWLLQTAPDLYLNGTLLQAEPWLMNDERIPTWKANVQGGYARLNSLSEKATMGSGPLIIRRNRRAY